MKMFAVEQTLDFQHATFLSVPRDLHTCHALEVGCLSLEKLQKNLKHDNRRSIIQQSFTFNNCTQVFLVSCKQCN